MTRVLSEKLLFNLYTNSFLETQLNINYKQKFKKWRRKVNQDTLVGLALIFVTMATMFSWIIYSYFKIFTPFENIDLFLV